MFPLLRADTEAGSKVSVLGKVCVAPQIFQLIELTGFPVKNVHDRVEVVHADPAGVLLALGMLGAFANFLFDALVDIFGDGLDLGVGIAFADDEKIRRCFVEVSEVQLDDVLAFDVLNAINNQVVQCFNVATVTF